MNLNTISFKANPIPEKGAKVAQAAVKAAKEELPAFHDYVGSRTVFPSKVTKAAEEANAKARELISPIVDTPFNHRAPINVTKAGDTVEFTNVRAPHDVGAKEVDEFTQLNKMYAEAQDKETIIYGKNIDIQG